MCQDKIYFSQLAAIYGRKAMYEVQENRTSEIYLGTYLTVPTSRILHGDHVSLHAFVDLQVHTVSQFR